MRGALPLHLAVYRPTGQIIRTAQSGLDTHTQNPVMCALGNASLDPAL
jgi:hypothetical protein